MPDFYGSHFEFGGQSSRRHKLILAGMETDRMRLLSGAIDGSTVFDRKEKRRRLINTNYDSFPVSITVGIVTDDESIIHNQEQRVIEKWLFNKHNYERFYIDLADDNNEETFEYVDGERKRLFLNCRFINPEKLEYFGGIVGYKATMEIDSGMWYQDAITKNFTLDHTSETDTTTVVVNVDTDIDDYTYPRIAVLMDNTGGDLSITNLSDNSMRKFKIDDLQSSTQLLINSRTNFVSQLYFDKVKGIYFPRLVDGENRIEIKGAVKSIAIQYYNRRWL